VELDVRAEVAAATARDVQAQRAVALYARSARGLARRAPDGRCDCLRPKAILPVLGLERWRTTSPVTLGSQSSWTTLSHRRRTADPRPGQQCRGGAAHLLWGTSTAKDERLLRARCRGEVRRRHGMRLWVGDGHAGEEVYVLRVTSSLVVSAALRSRCDGESVRPLDSLEEPDDINRFKADSDYAEDVELATMHRSLETLRAAMNWGMAQTPPLFKKSPFHRFGVRLNKKAETMRDRRQMLRQEAMKRTDSALTVLAKNGWRQGATLMIRSSRWQALIAVGAVAASVTVDAQQSPARCRTDCTIGKQSVVTLSGVEALMRDARPRTGPTPTIGAMIVRDSRGRYAAVSVDFRQLLIFDAAGKLLDSPRPTYGRIVRLFVDPTGAVQAYDSTSGSLLTFDGNYQVKTKTELPHDPALPLGGGRFLVENQIPTPALVGHPLHVMSKDGNIVRSFGADGSPVHSEDAFKNRRVVCLNPDGTIWSIAPGGRLLERWDTATGRRLSQVTVKSTWFRESSRPAPQDQVANPIILTIWAEEDLVWILYRVADPQWIPRRRPERELGAAQGKNADLRSDWVLEAVRSDTGSVVAMKSFDRILLRRAGSRAIASETASAKRGVELWTPILVKKQKKP
jgi:hypothetical protein